MVYFNHIITTKNTLLHFISFYFVGQFIYLPIQDLILASNEFKAIDNPLARIGCNYLLLCVQVLLPRLGVILLLVRLTLVLTEGNFYLYYTSPPFLFWENPNIAHK